MALSSIKPQFLDQVLSLMGSVAGEFSLVRRVDAAWVVLLAICVALALLAVCLRLLSGHRQLVQQFTETTTSLPDEIMLRVFSFMSIHDLARASSVCKQWQRVSRDEDLWADFCLRDFRTELAAQLAADTSPTTMPSSLQYYDFYKARFAEASKWSLEELQRLGSAYTVYVPHSIVLAAAPLALAIVVAIFVHWLSGDIDIDWSSLGRGWHPQDVWEFVFGIIFIIALAVFVQLILPIIQFALQAVVEPAFLFLGHRVFSQRVGEMFGISLSDHKTLTVLLGASFISFVFLCAILLLLILNLALRLKRHVRTKRQRKIQMLRGRVLQPKWLT
eukprot:TRINITY_DN11067_c0_g1_i1.p1 TRINITY_DN11067_c0_g1~~TRINITY_DN11067_c0_g1_i1.p1  ORF type:complete len:332 (-),score=97.52 TRINITY_DN11067_c0_g1_i1:13-1008(-)